MFERIAEYNLPSYKRHMKLVIGKKGEKIIYEPIEAELFLQIWSLRSTVEPSCLTQHSEEHRWTERLMMGMGNWPLSAPESIKTMQ